MGVLDTYRVEDRQNRSTDAPLQSGTAELERYHPHDLSSHNELVRDRALNAPSPPEQPLSPPLSSEEQRQVGNIVKSIKGLRGNLDEQFKDLDKPLSDNVRKEGEQLRLDVEQSLALVCHDKLERLLPAVNKELEASGLKIAEVPANKEIAIGRLMSQTGEYHSWDVVSQVECLSS
jgi:hypothetical protein